VKKDQETREKNLRLEAEREDARLCLLRGKRKPLNVKETLPVH